MFPTDPREKKKKLKNLEKAASPSFSLFRGHQTNILWMDEIHFAPPKKPWNESIPLQIPTTVMVATTVSKWCRISSVHRILCGISTRSRTGLFRFCGGRGPRGLQAVSGLSPVSFSRGRPVVLLHPGLNFPSNLTTFRGNAMFRSQTTWV